MPEMTGLELYQDLGRRGVQIPTIIITARNEAETREQCASAGVIAFLPEPINDVSLFAAIELAGQLGRAQ